ncbi:MAG: 4Fe-4S binding protein [Candidatus Omnitrophica bacterium]|nr:4Fe-4S binding protein [Candidatus Omnitrophota bacterium]
MKKAKIFTRRFVQACFIFLFFYLLSTADYFPLPENIPFDFFFRIDGLLAISTTISTVHFSKHFIPALVIMLFIIIAGNFFCFWICPFGGIIDFTNLIMARKKRPFSIGMPVFFRKIRLFLLSGFLLMSLLALFAAAPNPFWVADPYVIITRAFILKNAWLFLFIAIFTASIIIPRAWCNFVCPLGCLYYYLGRIRKAGFFKKKNK